MTTQTPHDRLQQPQDVLRQPQDVSRQPPDCTATLIEPNGLIPNNSRVPLLVYKQAVSMSSGDPAAAFEALFTQNNWRGSWRDGIYGFHHYHSTAHEVLGIYRGTATVQLGGDDGLTVQLSTGDVVVIPAGVAHKNLGSSRDFGVVGAYPAGQQWDMNYGKAEEHPQVDENIAGVPKPGYDPLYGERGPLVELW